MKKTMMMLVAAAAVSFGAFADTETVDGITWTYTVANGCASVGGGSPSYNAVPISTSGSITIPSTLGGYPVTKIGLSAFQNCRELTSVTIPDGVTVIDTFAFSDCRGLMSVTIPNGVTNIGYGAFHGCDGLTSVTIPNSVVKIGEGAFAHCRKIEYFVVDDDNPVFSSINGMLLSKDGTRLIRAVNGEMRVPDGVTCIEDYAFSGYYKLTSISIPKSVRYIGSYAFCNCLGLTAVHISDIAAWCEISFCSEYYSYCQDHYSSDPFDYQYYYSSNPLVYAHKLYLNGELITELAIPEGVTHVNDFAFMQCSSLKNVIIPNSVMSIGALAFFSGYLDGSGKNDERGLTNVTFGNSVTNIGEMSFCGCSGLASVMIPYSMINIGNGAFRDCSSLGLALIPVTLKGHFADLTFSSGAVVYYRDDDLHAVTFDANGGSCSMSEMCRVHGYAIGELPDAVRSGYVFDGWFTAAEGGTEVTAETLVDGDMTLYAHWTAYAWTYRAVNDSEAEICAVSPSPVGAIAIPVVLDGKFVTSIGEFAFSNCSNLTSMTIPDTITNIAAYAFSECSDLTRVTIPNSVTSIGDYAFKRCRSLTSVEISSGVAIVGQRCFSDCSGLTSVTIPDTVTNIAAYAFSECSNLMRVTIPDSVTSIGDYAFKRCRSLTSMTIPNSVTSIGCGVFSSCDSLANVSIPNSVTNIEDHAFEGCGSLTSVTIPDSVTSIGRSVFAYCRGLTSVTIPNSVTSIGDYAFEYCSGLTRITIPDAMTNIGNALFIGCYNLTSVDIPASVTNIGAAAFAYCSRLTSVTIPDSVTSIGSAAFSCCDGLTSITIPGSVTSMGDGMLFNSCSNLTSVTLGAGVTSIGTSAFINCVNLTSVTIPDGVTKIGNLAFKNCESLTSVMIPNSVTNIGGSAFYNCSRLIRIIFNGNAPSVVGSTFDKVASGCEAYVSRNSSGWGVEIPSVWNGLAIRYYDSIVTFDIGEHGTRTGGGELVQAVEDQAAAVAPEVAADEGWEFLGWDADFSCVTSNMTVNALWRRVYSLGEALGADSVSAALPWTVGTNGVAAAKGSDDATATCGKSVKFTADDESVVWVETVVTNACRVSFDWKCSCEPLVKGRPYDFLVFEVDGERMSFICGEKEWTNVTFHVTGEGEHVLCWAFQRDEDGASGEDSAWLASVSVVPSVTVAFDGGGATAGSAPEPITAYADESVVLPNQGSLAWPKHTFLGWSDGNAVYGPGDPYPCGGALLLTAQWAAKTLSAPVIAAPATYEADSATVTITADEGATIYYTLDGSTPDPARLDAAPYLGPFEVAGSATIRAIAVRDDYFDSEVASATVTRLTWTFGEYLNWPEQVFITGGDAEWTRAKGVSTDGYALRSGAITHSRTSRLETVVSGPGTVTFSCKVSGEIVKRIVFDGLAFCIDGVQQGDLMGNADWEVKAFEVAGGGTHTLSWLYVKDEDGTVGDDCAWLDEVVWISRPIPAIASDASAEAVNAAVDGVGFADAGVKAAICGSAAEYLAFKSWADGIAGGEAAVVASPSAAAAYLLGATELFGNEPNVEITEVATGGAQSSASDAGMTVSVVVKDGERAVAVNAEKVAAMFEATSDLGDWDGSTKLTPTVEVLEGDGVTMRFRVTPGDGTASSAFLRIRK